MYVDLLSNTRGKLNLQVSIIICNFM